MFQNGEIEQVIEMFEKPSQQNYLPYTGGNLQDKAPRELWKSRTFYNNGELNNQFIAFLAGYSYGKVIGRDC